MAFYCLYHINILPCIKCIYLLFLSLSFKRYMGFVPAAYGRIRSLLISKEATPHCMASRCLTNLGLFVFCTLSYLCGVSSSGNINGYLQPVSSISKSGLPDGSAVVARDSY